MSQESGASSTQPTDFMNTSPLFDFNDPNTRHDRVIIVEGHKFYVQMGLLAGWSEYFFGLITCGLKESQEHEIEIKDVMAEDFKCFLVVIYPTKFKPTVDTLFPLISLSYRFLAPRVLEECEEFIDQNFDELDKLDLLTAAMEYNIPGIKEKVANYIKNEAPVGPVRRCNVCASTQGLQFCVKCNATPRMKPYKSLLINNTSYVVKNKDRILAAPIEVRDFLLNTLLTCD